jgi:hypothetical protein
MLFSQRDILLEPMPSAACPLIVPLVLVALYLLAPPLRILIYNITETFSVSTSYIRLKILELFMFSYFFPLVPF